MGLHLRSDRALHHFTEAVIISPQQKKQKLFFILSVRIKARRRAGKKICPTTKSHSYFLTSWINNRNHNCGATFMKNKNKTPFPPAKMRSTQLTVFSLSLKLGNRAKRSERLMIHFIGNIPPSLCLEAQKTWIGTDFEPCWPENHNQENLEARIAESLLNSLSISQKGNFSSVYPKELIVPFFRE